MNLVQTVKKTPKGYNQKQIRNSKITWEFQAKAIHPRSHDLKAIISTDKNVNCSVTVNEIDHTKTIFGHRLPIFKVKTTRQFPEAVIYDYVGLSHTISSKLERMLPCLEIFYLWTIFCSLQQSLITSGFPQPSISTPGKWQDWPLQYSI